MVEQRQINNTEEHISPKDYFNAEDYSWLEMLAGYWAYVDEGIDYEPFTDDEKLAAMCASLAESLLSGDAHSFERRLEYDDAYTHRQLSDPTFARLVELGLEYGVACGDGACANFLGALYDLGQVVEQNFFRAKELFELAESKGIERAILNLGYIYEYGYTAEPDYLKAFIQYTKAALLTGHTESLYKMGDMYARAQVVKRDLSAAYRLYQQSLDVAKDVVDQAQPAFRIAELVSNPDNEKWNIPYDPMRALALYQLAERGLRIDIAHGQAYYTDRLQKAIAGQARMREVLDGPDIIL